MAPAAEVDADIKTLGGDGAFEERDHGGGLLGEVELLGVVEFFQVGLVGPGVGMTNFSYARFGKRHYANPRLHWKREAMIGATRP